MIPNILSIVTIFVMTFPFLFNSYIFMDLISNGENKFKPGILYICGLLISMLLSLFIKLGISKLSKNALVFRKDSLFINNDFVIDRSKACGIMDLPKIELGFLNFDPSKYSVVSLYTLSYGYLIGYLLLGKILLKRGDWLGKDTFILIISLLYSIFHILFFTYKKCIHGYEGLMGLILGSLLGIFWNWVVKPRKMNKKKYCGLEGGKWMCEGEHKYKGYGNNFNIKNFVFFIGLYLLLLIIGYCLT